MGINLDIYQYGPTDLDWSQQEPILTKFSDAFEGHWKTKIWMENHKDLFCWSHSSEWIRLELVLECEERTWEKRNDESREV